MERGILDLASSLVDEMSLRLEAVLKGTIVLARSVSAGEDLLKTLRSVCAERLCLARVVTSGAEGSVVILRGTALAAYLRTAGGEISGAEALEKTVEAVRGAGGSVTVYELSEREFEKRYAEVVKRVKERRPTAPEGIPSRAPRVDMSDVRMRVLNELRAAGLPLASLTIELRDSDVKILAEWTDSPHYPSHVALVVIRELASAGISLTRVELESKVRGRAEARIRATSRVRLRAEDPAVWAALASVLKASARHGFLVRSLSFKLRGDLLRVRLYAVIPYGRALQLSPASYRSVAKTVAEDVLRSVGEAWPGRVEVRASVGFITPRGYVWFWGRAP